MQLVLDDLNFCFWPKRQVILPVGTQKDGGWHERTNSVVISEQETKMEGVQHVYNIDAALVCEDRLREYT